MDYPYEQLDPDSFQQAVQALVVRAFPDSQVFPIGEADGGRDLVNYGRMAGEKGFSVYQVKFVRDPESKRNFLSWLESVLKGESEKMNALEGLTRYVLVTNLPGTGKATVGSIDKAQQLLEKYVRVPGIVWWRDDLNARFDNAWDLKWRYPQLLSGPDFLRLLIEGRLDARQATRTNALRAYLADQYMQDEEVRFQQVELQNSLLDLFIDVPVGKPTQGPPRHRDIPPAALFSHIVKLNRRAVSARGGGPEIEVETRDDVMGAASLLLHDLSQSYLNRVVLEGAPGQGKSTITQYVAQVHRMRLLDKQHELHLVGPGHRKVGSRLPLRIDLRDLAAWLTGRNPFGPDGSAELPPNAEKSLESLLAAQISARSGGFDFTVEDLHAVSGLSPVLLICDGLDEVAEIELRRQVVDEIRKAIRRLESNSMSLQVVVTSRPAAFANSPGMSPKEFIFFSLEDLGKSDIDAYATKWLKARKLNQKDQSAFRRTLNEKLDLSHIRELARNPMQLAILLSLIHQRGASLPDKRTALYDSYVELFFNRESEKSAVVRTHRDLLIEIHRYLAWILHGEAEAKGGGGRLSKDRLQLEIRTFVEFEGHSTTICDALFQGLVERVVMLVARVQGAYEFEVQPLREYFAARFLYGTAPYSPPGREVGGTKPDRFDALARDFYWANVTRFYAGCYSKGELPSLIDNLKVLAKEQEYARTNQPRMLAATLLGDWVFAQNPRMMREAVDLVLDPIGLRYVISGFERRISGSATFVLPLGNGRDELVAKCFELLRDARPFDFAVDVIELVRRNATRTDLVKHWRTSVEQVSAENYPTWLRYAYRLGIFAMLQQNELQRCFHAGNDTRAAAILMSSKAWPFFEHDTQAFENAVAAILDRQFLPDYEMLYGKTACEQLAGVFATREMSVLLSYPSPERAIDVLDRYSPHGLRDTNVPVVEARGRRARELSELVELRRRLWEAPAIEWAHSLGPWSEFVERSRGIFGARWVHVHIACMAAGIRSHGAAASDGADLFDDTVPLCSRSRYARLRAGNKSWWLKNFERADDSVNCAMTALLFFAWASHRCMLEVLPAAEECVEALPPELWAQCAESLADLTRPAPVLPAVPIVAPIRLSDQSPPPRLKSRTATLLAHRTIPGEREQIVSASLMDYEGEDTHVLAMAQQSAAIQLAKGTAMWARALDAIARGYERGPVADVFARQVFSRQSEGLLDLDAAKTVADAPQRYPGYLVAAAEERCRAELAKKVTPVAIIAREKGWTF